MIWELKALACLLLYPDDDLLESLPEIDVVLQKSEELEAGSKKRLDEFVAWVKGTDLTSLQSAYVSTFDIGKHASLNLFEHTQGDSRDRGHVMVELNRLYKEHGLDRPPPNYRIICPFSLSSSQGSSVKMPCSGSRARSNPFARSIESSSLMRALGRL